MIQSRYTGFRTDDNGNILPNVQTPSVDVNTGMDLNGMFDGIDLGGIGSLASAVGGIMQANSTAKYQNRLADMEEDRIKRDEARQDKYEGDMAKAFA